jgi:hypothetical protein
MDGTLSALIVSRTPAVTGTAIVAPGRGVPGAGEALAELSVGGFAGGG